MLLTVQIFRPNAAAGSMDVVQPSDSLGSYGLLALEILRPPAGAATLLAILQRV
jgi:hypothetical protein